jgi:hypothetical protein
MLFCTYRYHGFADGDEVAFASNLALQAFFEGRKINKEDMEKCLEYWRQNIAEMHDPVGRKRDVMCEPFRVPCIPFGCIYRNCCQIKRKMPYKEETKQLREAYDKYEQLRLKQIDRWDNFRQPVRLSTVCQILGCRRFCGRKGLCFCTEGCNDNPPAGCCYKDLGRRPGDPFPPQPHPDLDDEQTAIRVLQTVLGNPPPNVVYKQWEMDSSSGKYTVVTHRATQESKSLKQEEPSGAAIGNANETTEVFPEMGDPSAPSLEVVAQDNTVTLYKGSY